MLIQLSLLNGLENIISAFCRGSSDSVLISASDPNSRTANRLAPGSQKRLVVKRRVTDIMVVVPEKIRDKDVRRSIMATLLADYVDDPETRIVEELGIDYGAHRVDIAAINGELHGFEIKSESDDLSRLPSQSSAYDKVFDRLTLIIHSRHIRALDSIWLRNHWAVLVIPETATRDTVPFDIVRPGSRNPDVDPLEVAKLLWRDELISLLESIGAAKGVKSKSRHEIARRVAVTLALDDLTRSVRTVLKSRIGWRADSQPS